MINLKLTDELSLLKKTIVGILKWSDWACQTLVFPKLIISARFVEHELKGIVLLEKEKLVTIATTLQKQPTTHKCLKSKLPMQNKPTEKKDWQNCCHRNFQLPSSTLIISWVLYPNPNLVFSRHLSHSSSQSIHFF